MKRRCKSKTNPSDGCRSERHSQLPVARLLPYLQSLTSTDNTLRVSLPVQSTPGLLDGLSNVGRHGTTLNTGHQTLGTKSPGEGGIPVEKAEKVGGGDELVGAKLSGEDLLDELLSAYNVGAGRTSLDSGGTLGEDDEEGGFGRRSAGVREEDAAAEGVELNGGGGLGSDVDLVGSVRSSN